MSSETHGGDLGALALAVCAVMADVPNVQETGQNTFHKYKYASDEDLLRALQPAMAAHGLALMPVGCTTSTVPAGKTQRGADQYRTDIVITYRLIHKSGGWLNLQSAGSGIDGEDKGAYKALTGAYKYVLRQTFAVPTGEDAERDQPQPRKKVKETPEERGERQAQHHASWNSDRGAFHAKLGEVLPELKQPYDAVADWCAALSRPRPSAMDSTARRKLLDYLGGAGLEQFWGWWGQHKEDHPLKPSEAA